MASTYSTSFRFELIATGEKSGTWGTTTNTNLGTLLEQAIGGYVSIAMSDANYTLTASNGASDEARNMTIRLTGSLTAGRNVSCPNSIEKIYIVDNATNQTITFKTVSGTGVAIPTNTKALVYADGTNVVALTGSLAMQAASAVAITGGTIAGATITGGSITGMTDITVADGGTGSSTAAGARTNLGAAASGANTDITTIYLNNTGLKVKDTDASHGLSIVPGSNLTADRTLTITTGDAARTLDISAGSVTISAAAATVLDDASVGAMLTTMGGLSTSTAASTYAPLASPPLTGTPTAPTAGGGTNTTQIATTAFVQTALGGASGTVLLGTLTTTSGSTQTLSGLNLTSYKLLFMSIDGVDPSTTTSPSPQGVLTIAGIAVYSTYTAQSRGIMIDLVSGRGYYNSGDSDVFSITTATTSISASTNQTFTAGAIRFYGLK